MSYDEVIKHLGDFGPYQKQIYFLLCAPAISCAFHKLAGVFLLARPNFRCVLPFEYNASESLTYDSWPLESWNLTYPYDNRTKSWQMCQYYDLDYMENNWIDRLTSENFSLKAIKECDQFVYDRSIYERTAVSEWNMICSRSLLSATSDSLFMIGVLFGSVIFGLLSDKYGRKPTFTASLLIQVIFGVLGGVAPDFLTYTIARLIVGATTSGVFLVAYVIAMEMVGSSYRLFAGVACQMFFSIGFMLTAAFAYFIRDWRWLQIALTLPGLLFLCYHWIIPESARWLLSNGRKDEAISVIEKAAKVNNVIIPREIFENLVEETADKKNNSKSNIKKPSVMDLMRFPNLRRKSLLIFFDWFVNSGTYYSLSWSTNNLGSNVLLNFVISGAVEIPAYCFLLLTLNKWGRRNVLCSCMLVAGISLLLTVVETNVMNWHIIVLAMIGKLAITASYGTVYIFSAEQFPTVVRNVGLGTASMIGRIGGIFAPYVNLLGQFWRPLPLIICGTLSLIGGLLSFTLPETLNRSLLETIEDGEQFGRRKPSIIEIGEEMSTVDISHPNNESQSVS